MNDATAKGKANQPPTDDQIRDWLRRSGGKPSPPLWERALGRVRKLNYQRDYSRKKRANGEPNES